MATKTKKAPISSTATVAFKAIKERVEQLKTDETQAVQTMSPGDNVRQGDLYIVALGDISFDALGGADPISDRQLAPGATQGSRHVADGPVDIFKPKSPSTVAERINALVKGAKVPAELVGPLLVPTEKCVITHPEHGHFVLPAEGPCAVVYQRQYAEDVRRMQD